MNFHTDPAQGGISTSCRVTFEIAFYLKWQMGGDFAGHLELEAVSETESLCFLKYREA